MENTNDKLVTPKVFDLAKKKGYTHSELSLYIMPSQSYLQRWLREVHRMDIQPICTYKQIRFYHLGIVFINDKNQVDTIILKDEGMQTNELFNSYEEALDIGLEKGLDLLSNCL